MKFTPYHRSIGKSGGRLARSGSVLASSIYEDDILSNWNHAVHLTKLTYLIKILR